MDFIRRAQNRQKTTFQIVRPLSNHSNDLTRILTRSKPNEARNGNGFDAIVEDFCSNTSVHGIRYFSGHHWIERVWWVCSFVLSVVLCVMAIQSIWTTWSNHPVTVTFDDKAISIETIPFPAVTICTVQKVAQSADGVKNFGDFAKLFIKDMDRLDVLSQTCMKENSPYGNEDSIPQNVSIYETIIDISPNRSSVIKSSNWLNSKNGTKLESIFTEEGLCFTFNSINSRELYSDEVVPELFTVRNNPNSTNWNAEDGYRSNINESEIYPYRVFNANYRNSLQIYLNIILDKTYQVCGFYAPGFMLQLTLPDDLAQFSNEYIYVPADQTASFLIKPYNVMGTSDDLRSYDPQTRGCYFRSERKLRFFRTYSQQKCEIECLTNFTKEYCGCVRFFMPRDQNTKICRFDKIDCTVDLEYRPAYTSVAGKCGCMPDCTSIEYEIEREIVQRYHSEGDEELLQKHNKTGFVAESVIKLSYKKKTFIMIKRSATSTMSTFISNCGGLLGLFMGASVLSLIELVYFFTLRLVIKFRKQKTAQSSTGQSSQPNQPNLPSWGRQRDIEVITGQTDQNLDRN